MDSRYIIGDNDEESDVSTETEYSSAEEKEESEEKILIDEHETKFKRPKSAWLKQTRSLCFKFGRLT